MKYTLQSVAGSLPPLHDGPQDFEEQIRLAKDERAERTMAPLRPELDHSASAPATSETVDKVIAGPAHD